MKYVALLRGINVGGNNLIKMTELKTAFEDLGFINVVTYINSGNIIFETDEAYKTKLVETIEKILTKRYNYKARVAVKSQQQVKDILANVPDEWSSRADIRCYVGFLLDPLTAEEAAKDVTTRDGVDSLKLGPGALYMTSLLSQLTKSAFNKLAAKKIYQEMTIRNYNTTKKLLELMEQAK